MADMDRSGTLRGLSVVNLLAGIWMIICPFAIGASTGARWNDVIFGVLIGLCAIGRMASPAARGLSWANVVFGIWLIISPFVLGFAGSGIQWNNVVTGIIVVVFGLWAAQHRLSVATTTESYTPRRAA